MLRHFAMKEEPPKRDEHLYYMMKDEKRGINENSTLVNDMPFPPLNLNDGLQPAQTQSSLIEDFRSYCSQISMLTEIAVCCALGISGTILPTFLVPDINITPVNETYQISSDGDVMLDPSLNHDYIVEATVSTLALIVITVVLPSFTIAVFGFMSGPTNDIHSGLCVLTTAVGSAQFFTQFFKRWVGRLRPNFYGMCGFDLDLLECTADENLQMEARQSFPSGHASIAFSGMTVLSLWFLGKVGTQRRYLLKAEQNPNISMTQNASYYKVLSFFSCAPFMFVAVYIAASRVKDYWHNVDDIIAGAVVGSYCASFSYHMWYPSRFSPVSGIPIHTLLQDIDEGRRIPT